MAGSSAFAFAREAHRSGLMSRREILSRRVGQPRLPAPGLDRPVHRPAARPGRPGAAGPRGARHPAHGAGDPHRGPAPGLSGDAARGLGPPGRRAAGLHRHRVLPGDGRPRGRRAAVRRRPGLGLGEGRRPVHRPRHRALHVPGREGGGHAGAGRARGLRPAGLLRLLGLRVRPAHAARGRQPGRGQPRHRAQPRGARGGLAGHALRAPAAAPVRGRRRRGGAGPGHGARAALLRRRQPPPAARLRRAVVRR